MAAAWLCPDRDSLRYRFKSFTDGILTFITSKIDFHAGVTLRKGGMFSQFADDSDKEDERLQLYVYLGGAFLETA